MNIHEKNYNNLLNIVPTLKTLSEGYKLKSKSIPEFEITVSILSHHDNEMKFSLSRYDKKNNKHKLHFDILIHVFFESKKVVMSTFQRDPVFECLVRPSFSEKECQDFMDSFLKVWLEKIFADQIILLAQ